MARMHFSSTHRIFVQVLLEAISLGMLTTTHACASIRINIKQLTCVLGLLI